MNKEKIVGITGIELAPRCRDLPKGSLKIAGDDVFDFLLDVRAINEGIDRRQDHVGQKKAPKQKYAAHNGERDGG